MNDHERFADTGDSLSDMATEFVVHCPKCDGKAWIRPQDNTWRLSCTSCFHVETPGHWYGEMTAYVSVKCRECRNPLRRSATTDGQWARLLMKCDQCGDECAYEAQVSRHQKRNGLMCDPVFGLPLWLQKSMGDNLFWAYHYDHLQLVGQYVRAKLRERGIHQKGSRNSLMFSRLPAFITKARHRKEILKTIEELMLK